MNVLYLTQVFEVGTDPGSERHFFFCRYLTRLGHSACAITSNVDYKKACVRIPGGNGTVMRHIQGVEVRYVYSYSKFRGSFYRRLIYFVTYFFSSLLESMRVNKPDVIYAVSTPLTVGLLGFIVSRIRGIPFVFEVTDVWPDAAVACNVIKNRFIIRLARSIESFCYRKAAHIIALTYGIRDNIIAKGVPADKVSVITNGVDFSLFLRHQAPVTSHSFEASMHAEPNPFIVMYMGAHGAYNALDTIIDAAIALKDELRVRFVLIGDGDAKAALQKRVITAGIQNVEFCEPVPRIEAPQILATADVFLLPNRKGGFFSGNLPNKLFDYLASARPVIVAGDGETAKVVERAGCGVVVGAEEGAAMAIAIQRMVDEPYEVRQAMGNSGKNYVMEHYDREKLSSEFLQILQRSTAA